MNREVLVPEGEISLDRIVYEGTSLHDVVLEAQSRSPMLFLKEVKIENLRRDGGWKSTDESTIVSPIIYLENQQGKSYIITKRPTDNKYVLAEYNRTP